MLGDVLYILLNHIVMKKKCFLGLLGMTLALLLVSGRYFRL